MKRFLFYIALAMVCVGSFTAPLQAQDLSFSEWLETTLPYDPAIRYGRLDNGLTYFIRHNINPARQAEFVLVQNVGSIVEEDNQQGLAHFLEHMAFEGTENFPGESLVNWLKGLGVDYGSNLNAYTSIDDTKYLISQVPLVRPSVQDSCLLILRDWACGISLDPEAIEAERSVIQEEFRYREDANQRVNKELLPTIYPGCRYAHRMPIGKMDVIANFPAEELKNFYRTWYRPDLQCVVVVGDVDVDYIEGKIKEIFSGIEMPANASERANYAVNDTPGTIYALGKDKEIQVASLDFSYKTDAFSVPREMRNTPKMYLAAFMKAVIQDMMNSRLEKQYKRPESKLSFASVHLGEFLISKPQDALTLSVYAKDGDLVPAFEEAYRELQRAAKHGFSTGEFDRARAGIISKCENRYSQIGNTGNSQYAMQYANVFLDNNPVPVPENEKQIYEYLNSVLTLDSVNELLQSIVSQQDNRVLMAACPDKEGLPIPTEEQYRATIEAVDKEDLEPYKEEVRTDPLIPHLPAPGKIVAEKHLDYWDATEFTLSNGVKVVVKPTDFSSNEIYMYALAGTKCFADSIAPSIKMLKYLNAVSLYDYSSTDLKEYYQGKSAAISFELSGYLTRIFGSTTPRDLPYFLEKVYAFFTGFNLKEDEFAANKAAVISYLANQDKDPQYIFQQKMQSVNFESPIAQMITVQDVEQADRQTAVDIFRAATGNAAGYTFAIVGSVDVDSIKPLINQYLATLPADVSTAITTIVPNPAIECRDGNGTFSFTTPMEMPITYAHVCLVGQMPFSPKNWLISKILEQLLTERIFDKLRMEMGAVYAIKAEATINQFGRNNATVEAIIPMKPEMKEEVVSATHDIFEAVANNVTEDDIAPLVKYIQKQYRAMLRSNDNWASAITQSALSGVPYFLSIEDIIQDITPGDVMEYMKELLRQDNYRIIILAPEEAAV